MSFLMPYSMSEETKGDTDKSECIYTEPLFGMMLRLEKSKPIYFYYATMKKIIDFIGMSNISQECQF